jgi:hypothetical protein
LTSSPAVTDLFADTALSGDKVVAPLDKVVALQGTSQSISVDNGLGYVRD